MIKTPNETCDKCGMEIEVPDYDETQPISKYFPKWQRAILKHAWQHHHGDFPQVLKSFTQFIKWLRTPEGKQWNRKQGHWRAKTLNGFVTLYCRSKNEATP
ncbi:unnamed protein product [marine sediment metagenome]|uniref:Uncharacterized protein n=1 Tax=marine sediment metagenome TaxID=412755 RepID=X1SZG2_9ZZZZ